ncbi:glycosyltransferase family 4 protein [Sansalvadorimonas sp. 2012CJ34-2]|uniref:Glycosyltransferase family 4 protein n=1 Tax=Parendozoicomonas callyspongiae TaxID=2942213 RepID=A0ABT0PLF8_9GAMM|nr:glycosyltransferase family 4 protein [Sansalvadorimonas sp. 2012CJ34-2]MCL6272207.1 glycosyltransferase family 4 protein [Sansalvadorimonas sp. 2012CJ34-2]
MEKRIKVLQLQPKYYIRENDLHEEILKGLSPEKFEVTSAYMREVPGEGGLISISEHVKYFDLSKKEMKGLRVKAKRELYEFCDEQQFDAVITHRFKACDLMMSLNKKLKIPRCISVVHGFGDYDRLYRRLALKARIDDAWRFVAVSAPVEQYLLNTGMGLSAANVSTINNAIDISKITSGFRNREELRAEYGFDNDCFVIGTIGRMVTVKGHGYLLEAFVRLLEDNPKVRLVIFGDGDKREDAVNYIRTAGIEQQVILAGHIESAYQYIPMFDVFVLPSLSEGLPLSIMEAMAAKVPVVASGVGGVEALLGGLGEVVKPKNVAELYDKLKFVMQSSQRKEIGEALRERLEKEYSIEAYRAAYRNLILS